jgi:hypothetical protein
MAFVPAPLKGTTMTKSSTSRAKPTPAPSAPPQVKTSRAETMIALMRSDDGASAVELATAVGWQVHSVRGFIAGTLKKRADLTVTATRQDGVTRYCVVDAEGAAS